MDRRRFLKVAATGAVGAAALSIAGCETAGVMTPGQLEGAVAEDSSLPEIEWQMATSWPPALDTIFGGAETVAKRVEAMTQGKFKIDARAAGELAPGLEVLNVVEQGAVPIGHTASYYYVGMRTARRLTAFDHRHSQVDADRLLETPQARLYASEVVTLALLYALTGKGNRAFWRWLTRDYRPLFPNLPCRTRLFRLFNSHRYLIGEFLGGGLRH